MTVSCRCNFNSIVVIYSKQFCFGLYGKVEEQIAFRFSLSWNKDSVSNVLIIKQGGFHMIPRMRTLPEAIREIRKLDPDSALTLTALRRMVNQGIIPHISVASKRLINLDFLLDFLQNECQSQSDGTEG